MLNRNGTATKPALAILVDCTRGATKTGHGTLGNTLKDTFTEAISFPDENNDAANYKHEPSSPLGALTYISKTTMCQAFKHFCSASYSAQYH